MKDAILIKGNKYGLSISINEQLEFEAIKVALFAKLDDSRKFFGSSKVSLSFEGRTLSAQEQKELIEVVQKASDLDIICVLDQDSETDNNIEIVSEMMTHKKVVELQNHRPLQQKPLIAETVPESAAVFHKGTLRSGQEVVTESSIIIMGNVHFGAKVAAKGNVIVIGKLNGAVHAGKDGNEKAFIVALNMSPTQLRIADVFGRAPDKKSKKIIITPQIAIVEDEQIVIENISRNIYDNLNFINYK
ncbi:MAG: septum site-determining protein MinC [Vallitaleaceae bacterium]|nr:septum site-determining protein MinC [Vallitaleaceae bacterium]